MTEINNFSDIRENFDTIKTLLNTIRAQGVLNTSDIDKLLEGINSKLDKINTDEDVELIKAFLSELKKNLDERYGVVVSKFGAIESLFSNLLKNSTEAVKTPELKELFDIVATNLSVFSREVVSQKETLADITLRIDAMRSDETQKKDIIKSITLVRNDVEKVSNGFDSIVISLNENFKTVLKTIAEIDQSEAITGFTDKLTEILNSSNTILSAIELIDKKNNQFEDAFGGLATQNDTSNIQKQLVELTAKSSEISDLVEVLTQKSYKMDNLSDKIDAAVNIIAGLKTDIYDKNDESTNAIVEKFEQFEELVKTISSNEEFENFKQMFESTLSDITKESKQLSDTLNSAVSEISKLSDSVKNIDLDTNFQKITSGVVNSAENIKEKFASEVDKLSQLFDVNITRTLNDISSNAEVLNSRLKESHSVLASLCEKNFSEVSDDITGLKEIIAQLDDNNVSANNAIFSNITDRLAIFENSLKSSLETQEDYVRTSSANVVEQILKVKNAAENIDYKLDSSAMEIGNSKAEFEALKESVEGLLKLDFVNVVKDLKVDLYAVKQDLTSAIDNSDSELSEKFTNDLFGKYELLISKLDSVEDEIKYAQKEALNGLQSVLNNISDSIVDILSYVSVTNNTNTANIETKLQDIVESVKDINLNYVESVRDVVDVIRVQVENNLKQMSSESDNRFNRIASAINLSNTALKQDFKNSYAKLIEMQENFDAIKEILNVNSITMSTNVTNILSASENVKKDFETKITTLKNTLLDEVTDFKNSFTCENADNISELKFNSENLYSRAVQQSVELKNELKSEIEGIIEALRKNVASLNESVAKTALRIEGANNEIIDYIKKDFTSEVNNSVDTIKTNTADILSEVDIKVTDVVSGFEKLDSSVENLAKETKSSLTGTLGKILENFVALDSLIKSFDERTRENINNSVEELKQEFSLLKKKFNEVDAAVDEDLARQISIIEGNFESINLMMVDIMNQATETLGDKIKKELSGAAERMNEALAEELEQYKTQIEELFTEVKNENGVQADFIKERVLDLNRILEEGLDRQNKSSILQLNGIAENLKDIIKQNSEISAADYASLKQKLDDFYDEINNANLNLVSSVKTQLDEVAKFVDSNLEVKSQEVNSKFEDLSSGIQKINTVVREFNSDFDIKLNVIKSEFEDLKNKTYEADASLSDSFQNIVESINQAITNLEGSVSQSSTVILDDIKQTLKTISGKTQNEITEKAKEILDGLISIQAAQVEYKVKLEQLFIENVKPEIDKLSEHLNKFIEENSINLVTQLGNTNSKLSKEISSGFLDVKSEFDALNERMDKDELTRMNVYQTQIRELVSTFNELIESSKELTKTEISSISELLVKNSQTGIEEYQQSIEDKINTLLSSSVDISAGELQTMEAYANKILERIDSVKQNSIVCKDLISNLIAEHFDIIAKNIEKETDVIIGDMLEQFGLLKDSQKDDMSSYANIIEGSVSGYIFDAVNDLKSYLDIKTNSDDVNGKLDTLRIELEKSFEETAENINKLLEVNVFSDAVTDLRAANEVLINSVAEKLNTKVQDFITENVSKKFDDKFNYFDKKFVDTIVDKYEEIKLLSNQYNKSFERITESIDAVIAKFADAKNEVGEHLKTILEGINNSIDDLKLSFDSLKAQIMNKSLDEAFHDAVHSQISGIEDLVKQQMGYIEDISELCCSNLPELAEMNTIVKFGIKQSIDDIKDKVNEQDANVVQELNQLKSDIITQFLNIFNQVSFVAEQEEILDFIQEKHSELITILSHIVTTVDGVETVKDNLAVVDNKVDSLKEDIDLINEKITAIMSSEGDIDYVYSLQDLESDIANLRLVLNDMKADNKSKEFEELISSTNNIYKLVETIKSELPKFEAEEFKRDFEALSEDIVSISTRTNKLLLASDESYKTLQDNLQDFKLVINDLDERTRNFPKEAGIDKIDLKLASLNTMMQNGAKTNQVFNQVFEYLAEWVDKAGTQIAAISDKVETLDDIGQIKVMLEDLRAEAQDNSESVELIEALSNVFEKQAKRIASLEAKLDRLIVDSTINSRNNKIDMSPIENTLNSFLVAIDDKMTSQQSKINSLESKLEEAVSLMDNKDTVQLTKKVGGMDRQLAKLNKSIEKIASNVVEK